MKQLQQIKRRGLSQLMEMIPGFVSLSRQIPQEITDQQLKRVEAIINSMTREERRDPPILNASRKRCISRGSGTTVQEINQLLAQFRGEHRVGVQARLEGKKRWRSFEELDHMWF